MLFRSRSAYEFYAPEQAARMDDPVVERQGNYLLFAVGQDQDGLEKLCAALMDGQEVDLADFQPDLPPAPDISEPDVSQPEPDVSGPDTSHPSAPFTGEELDQARQAALDYYAGTVFDVTELVFEEQMANTASFTVKCSKGGVTVDPARSIVLELQDGAWTVVNEGY